MNNEVLPTYSIKEIARIIKASIPTTTKHIKRLVDSKHLIETVERHNSRVTKVYSIDKDTLQELKQLVSDNKQTVLNNKGVLNRGVLNTSNADTNSEYDKLKADRDEFMKLWMTTRDELAIANANIKLITDTTNNEIKHYKDLYFSEINTSKQLKDDLQKELTNKNRVIMTLSAILITIVAVSITLFAVGFFR